MSSAWRRHLLPAAVLMALAAVAFSQMGSGTRNWGFPRLITVVILVVGITLVIDGVRRMATSATNDTRDRANDAERRGDEEGPASDSPVGVALFSGGLLCYIFVIPVVGFWLASFAALWLAAALLSPRRGPREIVLAFVVSLCACAVGYFLFIEVFFVPLPSGPLLELLR